MPVMQVIEAQRASILVPHDHLHNNQLRMFRVERLNLYRYASLHPFGVRQGTGRTR